MLPISKPNTHSTNLSQLPSPDSEPESDISNFRLRSCNSCYIGSPNHTVGSARLARFSLWTDFTLEIGKSQAMKLYNTIRTYRTWHHLAMICWRLFASVERPRAACLTCLTMAISVCVYVGISVCVWGGWVNSLMEIEDSRCELVFVAWRQFATQTEYRFGCAPTKGKTKLIWSINIRYSM